MLVPDTAQLQFHLRGGPTSAFPGLDWFWSLYVRDTVVGWTQPNINTLAGFGVNWWDLGKMAGAAVRTWVTGDWQVQSITARDLGATPGNESEQLPVNLVGLRAGPPYNPGSPAIVRFRGDVGGAPTHGRIFWSGLNESDIDADDITTSVRTGLALLFENFRQAISLAIQGGSPDWAQVIVSRNSGTMVDPSPPRIAVPRATAVTNTLAGAIDVRRIIGAQRNRRTKS